MKINLDWRNPEDYKFTETLEPQGWAWQFLRRNQEYQQDWKIELKKYLSLIEREGSINSILSIDHPTFVVNPYKPDYQFKWGMYLLRNPQTDKPVGLDFEVSPSRAIYRGRGGKMLSGKEVFSSVIIPEGCAAIIFDLSKPIKQQIKNANQNLLSLQSVMEKEGNLSISKPRLHKDNWSIYLRVLDAKTEGVTSDKIAEIIFIEIANAYPEFKGRDKVKKTYIQAKAIMNGGYLNIPDMKSEYL